MVALTVGILGLQIALPWISYQVTGSKFDEIDNTNDQQSANAFWRNRFRFDALLNPRNPDPAEAVFLSGTVCKGELFILLRKSGRDRSQGVVIELIRVNLRHGQIATCPVAQDVRHVLSDGDTLWYLPHDVRVTQPFLWGGRPVAITPLESGRSHYPHRLVQYEDGQWRDTDRFALLPFEYHFRCGDNEFANDCRQREAFFCQHGQVINPIGSPFDIYYHGDLVTGTAEEQLVFHEQFGQITEPLHIDIATLLPEQLELLGWSHEQIGGFLLQRENPIAGGEWAENALGVWFENNRPCAMTLCSDDEDHDQETLNFAWCRYEAGGKSDFRMIPSPIRWDDQRRFMSSDIGCMHIVSSATGEVYLFSYDSRDGRIHILKWEEGRLRLIARRGSTAVALMCLDASIFFCLGTVFPIILLALIACFDQWRRGTCEVFHAHRRAMLASVVPRGIARIIDLMIPSTMLFLSLALHPDLVCWWRHLVYRGERVRDAVVGFSFEFTRHSLITIWEAVEQFLLQLAAAPLIWLLVIPALAFFFAQAVCQARTGYTIGKWLLGLRVVRPTLQNCGIARSLLREILFAFDSLLLVSWIPGVISILTTDRSQRLGDVFSDTIVICDVRPLKQVSNSAECDH